MTVTSLPHPAFSTPPVPAPPEDVILRVDTHKDIHGAAVITTLGASLTHQEFPTTAAGQRQLSAWARSFGVVRCRSASRRRVHWILWDCPDPSLTAGGHRRRRGQPARSCHAAQARQDRHHRCGYRRKGRSVGTRPPRRRRQLTDPPLTCASCGWPRNRPSRLALRQ